MSTKRLKFWLRVQLNHSDVIGGEGSHLHELHFEVSMPRLSASVSPLRSGVNVRPLPRTFCKRLTRDITLYFAWERSHDLNSHRANIGTDSELAKGRVASRVICAAARNGPEADIYAATGHKHDTHDHSYHATSPPPLAGLATRCALSILLVPHPYPHTHTQIRITLNAICVGTNNASYFSRSHLLS